MPSRDVDDACAAHDGPKIGITLGNASSVGTVGATLGGGVGTLARFQGLAIDNLISATLVLADG